MFPSRKQKDEQSSLLILTGPQERLATAVVEKYLAGGNGLITGESTPMVILVQETLNSSG